MKKVLITFLTLFACVAGYAQVTVTLGSALLQNPGTTIHLPVTVKGLNGASGGKGVTGIELHVAYANNAITYDTTLNFSSLTPATQWFFGANGTEYSTNWLEPTGNKLNIPDNTVLFDLVVHYLGGSTELTFDTARCLLIDSAFNILSGVHYINGVITPSLGSGESRWNGTGPWNTVANWSNGIPGDSTNAIIETGVVAANSNAVCKSITINAGTTISISTNFSLSVHRNYVNNGSVNLLSDATGTGSLIVRGSVTGAGVNSFKRYLNLSSVNGFLCSSPVSGATAAVFGTNTAEKYNEGPVSWTSQPATGNLESGLGYRISGNTSYTATFQGTFNTSDVSVSNLSYTGSGQEATRGLNLVGNPFPSAIQCEQGNWGKTGLDNAVYVWSGYKYVTWNGSVGALTDGIIPAMQGFFVKANAAGASLTIPAGSRLHSSMPYYKSTEAVTGMISMKVANTADTNHFDEAFVHVLSGSTTGFDSNHDAWKLAGNSAYPQIYTRSADQGILSINTQPDFTSVQVGFEPGTAGSFRIAFGNTGSFTPGQPLFFEDKNTSTVINIRNTAEFVFTSDGTTEPNRFVLHFQEVGIKEHAGNLFTVSGDGTTIRIIPKTGTLHADQLEIFNLAGRLVFSTENLELPGTIQQQNLITGLYILRIKTTDGIYTMKLLVQ